MMVTLMVMGGVVLTVMTIIMKMVCDDDDNVDYEGGQMIRAIAIATFCCIR